MLSLAAMSSGQAGYYLNLAREDYYLQGGEPEGIWFGKGAERLGLKGVVEADNLYNLFDGLWPNGQYSLIQTQHHADRAQHRPGWDATFSAPKSLSTLWSQSVESDRQAIQRAHAQAVVAALSFLEDTVALTRRGKEGKTLERVGLMVAMFEHSTSRALDPNLHTHALILNLSVRDDGTSGALSSLHLFNAKMAAGTIYRAELCKLLQQDLGLKLRRESSWFEVEDVPYSLIKAFSKRREQVEEELGRTGLTSAQAASAAAIQTREAKGFVSRELLFPQWHEDGLRHGWSEAQTHQLYDQVKLPTDIVGALRDACRRASERLTQTEAFFTEIEFIRYVAEESQTNGPGAAEVRAAASEYLMSQEIVRLGEHQGASRFTTPQMFALEADLLSRAEVLSKRTDHQLAPETVMKIFVNRDQLSEEQTKAIWNITAAGGDLAIVSGIAGGGKTTLLSAAREAWEAEGYHVFGLSTAARVARELQEGSGITSATIARTLIDLELGRAAFNNETIVVIDEAGMVATPEMRKLFHVCQESGSKMVLVGDGRQLPPIGPGAPFKELGHRLGQSEIKTIRRQEEEWARQAVLDMAEGRSLDALLQFASRGLLSISQTKHEAMDALIQAWRQDGLPPKETLILAGTRDEARALNRLAQEARLLSGELTGECCKANETDFYVRDRVMFTQNKPALGIDNGSKGTIVAVDPDADRVTVLLDSGPRVTFQSGRMPGLELGYSCTTHKAQGATTSHAYVLGGGAVVGRELSYVQTSRARLQTRIFGVTNEVGDAVQRLAWEMQRAIDKKMAHSLKNYHEL